MLKKLTNIHQSFKKLIMCKKCHSFYYKKSWHFETPEHVQKEAEGDALVRLTECPACLEFEATLSERDGDYASYGVAPLVAI